MITKTTSQTTGKITTMQKSPRELMLATLAISTILGILVFLAF